MNKPLLILVGPTAVGKTDISISVAKSLNCEIISADSMQVYKYMDIGTAKLSAGEMQGIKHYMIDEVYPDEEFSVAVFREKAGIYIDEILSKGKLPMVVGGTGLYINSLIYSLDFTETISDWDYRNNLKKMAEIHGNSYVHEMLKDIDPDSYKRLHTNDLKRVIRALEVFKHTGKTISEIQEESRKKATGFNYCMVGLTMDRQKLYERINKRVDIMIEKGLVDEVSRLLYAGYEDNLISMQGLGYKEIISYLKNECSLEEAVSTLKQSTRHFAKRQLTWFRRLEEIYWVNIDEFHGRESIVENIISYTAGKLNLA